MLILTNGRLIDGNGKKPVEKATITIKGNLIDDVGTTKGSYPKEATVIDLKGLVVMPGLMDLHYHCGGIVELEPDKPNFVGMADCDNYVDAREWSIENGVTSIRSAGDFFPDIVKARDMIASGRLNGPRFFVAGPLFTAPGGHPAYTIMQGIPYIVEHATRQVDDPKVAREEIKKLIDGGVDFIKIILQTSDVWDYPKPVPKLSLNVLDALLDEAHKNDRRTIVHAETPDDAFDAVKVGADSIEHIVTVGAHSVKMPDGLIQMMCDQRTYVVPALTTVETFEDKDPRLPKRLDDLKKIIKLLYDAGVNIACGTDAGAPDVYFGRAAHREMQIMVDLGMTPMDAIVSATMKSAENLGKGDELGTIEKGKLADIIVITGDPLKNIADTKNIKLVIKDGKIMFDKIGLP
jgi:enamidase